MSTTMLRQEKILATGKSKTLMLMDGRANEK
jgi:hypothetical protein